MDNILHKMPDNHDSIDEILKYINIQLKGFHRLAEITNDPMWYHAKIDALQDLESYIMKKYMI